MSGLQTYVDNVLADISVVLYAGEDYTSYPGGFPAGVNKKFLLVGEIQLSSEKFQYTFQLPFHGGVNEDELTCILDRIIPSNVLLLLYYV